MTPDTPPVVALTFALALVKSSTAPVLLLDGSLAVLAASASFCDTFQIKSEDLSGRLLANVGSGEWDVPQLSSLLRATASGLAEIKNYEMDFVRAGEPTRTLVVNATKLEYADAGGTRLVLTVLDVTHARAAEKLKEAVLHNNDVLIKEINHRVANSLQIIASVLLQNARSVQSEESRLHLTNAHQRVMSVAALQKQLATSSCDDVQMGTYLTSLCDSIAASMISDRDHFSLDVSADQSIRSAHSSVSIGLIVTELVINALKHAFTDQPSGKILVDYHSKGLDWNLSVRDTGIGMPSGPAAPKAGLGTTIVHSLATQLGASILVSDAHPGTLVAISHVEVAPGKPAASKPAA